jgi:methionyl-tRNA formyltransferase
MASGIKVAFGREGEEIVRDEPFDVLLVCTYHRILRSEVFGHAGVALNFHPSLLPAYRGASPFYWVIRNGESKTGLTAHYLTSNPDAGDILSTVETCLDPGETQGSLRKKLSKGAFELTLEVIRMIKSNSLNPIPQDETQSSYFPRVNDDIREIDLNWTAAEMRRHLDALKPFPGALHNGSPVSEACALSLLP